MPQGQIKDEDENQQDNNNNPNNRTVELLTTVIQYIINVKLETIIKVMLEHHNSDGRNQPITSQLKSQINSLTKDQMQRLIAGLLQAAFTTDEQTWFDLLQISGQQTDEHYEHFISVTEAINQIFDNASYDLNRTNPIQVSEE